MYCTNVLYEFVARNMGLTMDICVSEGKQPGNSMQRKIVFITSVPKLRNKPITLKNV